MSSQPPSDSSPFRLGSLFYVIAFLILVAGGFGAWWWLKPPGPQPNPPPDMEAAIRANNRGVGLMEQFRFREAIEAFEEVTRLAPDWQPGTINLGIALINNTNNRADDKDRAEALFEKLVAEDPKNPYGNFCLGLMRYSKARFADAADHFGGVTRADADDAYSWYWLGTALVAQTRETTDPVKRERALACLREAIRLDPYLRGAMYTLQNELRQQNQELEAAELLKTSEELRLRNADNPLVLEHYAWQGRYSRVIGAPPASTTISTGPVPLFRRNEQLQVKLRPGARWASAADFKNEPHAELRLRLRERLGGVMVVLDYNRDGLPDLFLVGAVMKDGRVRDLLLRNDGKGGFTDVTAEAGLDQPRPGVGCCVADFDNDGYPDLLLTGVGEQHLFRHNGKDGFEDVTQQAGLDQLKTVCVSAAFVDLDQDGDLDLVLGQLGTPEDALAFLKGDVKVRGAGLAVFENVGKARAGWPINKPPALDVAFKPLKEPAEVFGQPAPIMALAVSDVDLDNDLDLVVLTDRSPPALVLNDRLLRFHRASLPASLLEGTTGTWNGVLAIDTQHHQRSDLFLVGPGQAPVLLLNRTSHGQMDVSQWFERGATNSPPLLQAQAIDLDRDSWTDVVGLSAQTPHLPLFLHNDGQRLVHMKEGLGPDAGWPKDLVAVAVANFSGDCLPHLMVWSETTGLQLHESQDNGNFAMLLDLAGERKARTRCNNDGFGAWVTAQVDSLTSGLEYTTLSAGPGQSRQPLLLGIGQHPKLDVLRLRWPDHTLQAEFDVPPCKLQRITETDRRVDSCPVLFAWDGQRFTCITDFLGAGSMGEEQPAGGTRYPRPEESLKIEGHQLVPRDGKYLVKIAEPMDEVTYLDRLQLLVVDHPSDVDVFPDERFATAEPPPSQEMLAYRRPIFPLKARDHHGHDVLAKLLARDRNMVDKFAHRQWPGISEEHWVELDFGDQLKQLGKERVVLFLYGWTDYAYPETMFAAERAGVPIEAPVLEQQGADGQWHKIAETGFPAGLPRMMTLELTGKLNETGALRLRTNLDIYWDQIFLATLLEKSAVHVTALDVQSATLQSRGFQAETSPDGKPPRLYDDDLVSASPPSLMTGRLTRLGDVTSLLGDVDDRFVVFGPGDEVTASFDVPNGPPVGWKRSFVLRTWGYCKDAGTFTATGDRVGPLPFRAMSKYPYGPEERYPHPEVDQEYNTRPLASGGR